MILPPQNITEFGKFNPHLSALFFFSVNNEIWILMESKYLIDIIYTLCSGVPTTILPPQNFILLFLPSTFSCLFTGSCFSINPVRSYWNVSETFEQLSSQQSAPWLCNRTSIHPSTPYQSMVAGLRGEGWCLSPVVIGLRDEVHHGEVSSSS